MPLLPSLNSSKRRPLLSFTRQQYSQLYAFCVEIVTDRKETSRRKAKAQKLAMMVEAVIGQLGQIPASEWGFIKNPRSLG